MNNLYHKIAITSVGVALGFALGANKEAKAATFTLTTDEGFFVSDGNQDGLGDYIYGSVPLPVGIRDGLTYGNYGEYFREEYRAFYEFNIAELSLASNTVISSAIFEGSVNSIERGHPFYSMVEAIGYVGDGRGDVSDFSNEGVSLGSMSLNFLANSDTFKLDATTFVNQIVSNGEHFAGFGFSSPSTNDRYKSYITLNTYSNPATTLTITTVDAEPVPEPTTIFGSALALSLGGWLKRKKSSQRNKTTPQH